MMRIRPVLFVLAVALTGVCAVAQGTRLLRMPDVSQDHVAFVYANDLWVAPREGGDARRLTSFQGAETDPYFSPDGKWVAFTGEYDGNIDVYVVSVQGGEPRRLTWHPTEDTARGWTQDGQKVIFGSGRTSAPIGYPNFWTVSIQGGMPEPMPIPRVFKGSLSPDGTRMAYQMIAPWESEFRNYRGGQNNPIRIIDLGTLQVEKLPWDGANDKDPVWVDNSIFFLSDRDNLSNVWKYDLGRKRLEQVTKFKDFDAKNLAGGGDRLVFEKGGWLWSLNPGNGRVEQIRVNVRGDFAWARPHWEKVGRMLTSASLSPTGKRALFEARGEIFTVPAKKGDWRNLTNSSGVADRAPAWSPDGEKISWFSDEGGEYQLVIADQNGENRKVIALQNPTFFYTPKWSPDSKWISFGDTDRNLWLVEVETSEAKKIDNEGFAHPERILYPEWSPDSKWIAYTKRLPNQYAAVMVYSVDSGEINQLTPDLADCRAPAWDKSGKYVYFLSSTDYGLNVGWLDMTSYERPVSRAIYLAVLSKEEKSPLLPESDEEEAKKKEEKKNGEEEEKAEKSKEGEKEPSEKPKAPEVKIDFDGLANRIVTLGVPPGNYSSLTAGAEGTVFYIESAPIPGAPGWAGQNSEKLHRWVMKDRKSSEVLGGVTEFALSFDGKMLLYRSGRGPAASWAITDAAGTPKPGDGKLDVADLQMKVDPEAEWEQMFREAWRYQRDFFYVDNVHGLDMDWAFSAYSGWLGDVRHRSDLTYILDILGGETAIGHSFTGGGDLPDVERVPVGLLGADLEVDSGRYRIRKIYTGENWNPSLRAPLSGPGIDAREGDYIISVDGVDLSSAQNPYSAFDRTADRQTRLRLSDNPNGDNPREIVVVPVRSEGALRRFEWIEANRRKVDELSGGKLAYVWLPNTGDGGYSYFNRYYFAQQDKKGAVIDERFNGGGSAADYMVELMSRELMGYFNNPVGDRQPFTNPNAGIWGPKVMIINDAAGSGGDLLPYMFRLKKIGPLVGTKTWGGLVGIWDVPPLIDGGFITAPRGGYYNLQGEWDVENIGVPPDHEVDQDPALVNKGHDPQLEKAVAVAMELLKNNEVKLLPQPPDPVRAKRPQ